MTEENINVVPERMERDIEIQPEATTTVQDASLTEAKFTNELKLKTVKDYVTPEMFGAKGDGTTDDTSALQAAIDSGKPIHVPDGTYIVSEPLVWTSACMLEMDRNARIKAKEGTNLSCLLGIRNDGAVYPLAEKEYIKGGVFDGNGCCDVVIGINYTHGRIEDCIVTGVKNIGIYIQHNLANENIGSGSCGLRGVRVANYEAITGTTGFYSGGGDDAFTNCTAQSVEVGFNVGNGEKIVACHAWIAFSSMFENSVAYILKGSGNLLSDCVSDTMRYGIKTIANYAKITAVNFSYYHNAGVATSEILSEYPCIVFDLFSANTFLSVTNLDVNFNNSAGKILSDNALTSKLVKFANLNLNGMDNVIAANTPLDAISAFNKDSIISVRLASGNITQEFIDTLTDTSYVTGGYSAITNLTGWCTIITAKNGTNYIQTINIRGSGSATRRYANGEWSEFS